MIVLGAILLILGFVLKVQILWTIGIILLVIGAVLWLLAPLAVPSAAGVTGIDRRVDDCRRVTERQSSSRATSRERPRSADLAARASCCVVSN